MRDTDQHTEDQYHDHMRRLADLRRQFALGAITVAQKRRYISEENLAYYRDDQMRSQFTGERLCQLPRIHDRVAETIEDATGAPPETVRIALDRRRALSRQAADTPGRAGGQLLDQAAAAYHEILATGRRP